MPKRALKFAKRARCEIRYLELFIRMMKGKNGGWAEWRNGGMAEWRNGGMEEWRNGGMAEWWNGGMAEWRNGGISKDADWMNILEREMPFCLKQKSQEMELQ